MNNFITMVQEIKVASTNHGVTVTDQFKNINGNELLAKLRACTHGIKDGSHWLRTALNVDNVGKCMPRSNDHAASLASMLIIDCDKRITANGEEKDGAPDPHMMSDILKRHNIAHVFHGSYSHYSGEINRCRIVLITSEPYNQAQLDETATR
ncbi:MAG: hypothetical protein NTW94_00370 [Legionellales bacterium]|nr:hypothetical protein [Legionellales bacterium]